MVIQPGEAGLDYSDAGAVIALLAFSCRALLTRLMPPEIASVSLAAFTMASALPLTVIWVLINKEMYVPTDFNWPVVACMVGFWVNWLSIAYYLPASR